MTLPVTERAALSDLVHRYAAYLDDHQFDSVATLFTVDAVLTVPDPPATLTPINSHRGRAAIAAAVAAVKAVARTEHAIVGEVYDEAYDGDRRSGIGRGRITCVAHHWNQRADDVVDAVWHLRYDDEYELTDAGWRISRRSLTINAIEIRPIRRLLPRDAP